MNDTHLLRLLESVNAKLFESANDVPTQQIQTIEKISHPWCDSLEMEAQARAGANRSHSLTDLELKWPGFQRARATQKETMRVHSEGSSNATLFDQKLPIHIDFPRERTKSLPETSLHLSISDDDTHVSRDDHLSHDDERLNKKRETNRKASRKFRAKRKEQANEQHVEFEKLRQENVVLYVIFELILTWL